MQVKTVHYGVQRSSEKILVHVMSMEDAGNLQCRVLKCKVKPPVVLS